MREFLLDRIKLVNELIVGGPRVEYADLVLILTAVLSACSARRWPGRGIDRNRFVELLISHSPSDAHCEYVCLSSLLIAKHISEADTPWGRSGEFMRIFRDDEVDLPYSEARIRYPHILPLELKQHTYASLIYSWLRCPYAHEYCMGGATSHVPAINQPARISYIGRRYADGKVVRIATFHLDYILSLATHHAESLVDSPEPKPQEWWLQKA